jgi:type II secretory pathway component PulF
MSDALVSNIAKAVSLLLKQSIILQFKYYDAFLHQNKTRATLRTRVVLHNNLISRFNKKANLTYFFRPTYFMLCCRHLAAGL